METSFSTMSSVDLCTQMDHTSLLQFTSSGSCSPAASAAGITASSTTPPLMHTLQPLPSDPADALVDYIDNLPKDEIHALMPSAVEDFHGMPDIKPGPVTSAEQYSICSTVDAKSFHEAAPATSRPPSQSSVPYKPPTSMPVSSSGGSTATAAGDSTQQFFYPSADPSALIEHSSSSSSVCSVPTSTVNPPGISTTSTDSNNTANLRPDLPTPPRKPLSPYMRFSKGVCMLCFLALLIMFFYYFYGI